MAEPPQPCQLSTTSEFVSLAVAFPFSLLTRSPSEDGKRFQLRSFSLWCSLLCHEGKKVLNQRGITLSGGLSNAAYVDGIKIH